MLLYFHHCPKIIFNTKDAIIFLIDARSYRPHDASLCKHEWAYLAML